MKYKNMMGGKGSNDKRQTRKESGRKQIQVNVVKELVGFHTLDPFPPSIYEYFIFIFRQLDRQIDRQKLPDQSTWGLQQVSRLFFIQAFKIDVDS